MPHIGARGRVRAWGIAAVSMGLLATGAAAVGTAPAAVSAAPGDDCKEAFPVDELNAGDQVEGLTVTKGTVPETFTGEVLGVIDDGITVDLDMIMVELEMPKLTETGGIWQGMSGSPVYAADGRLIGAVAYGLSWGPSPIAGVTPFEDMDDYLGAEPAEHVAVDGATARTIARASDVTVAQAEEGLDLMDMPMGIAGLTGPRLAKVAGADKPYAPKNAYRMGGASGAAAAGPETIVAGGNLAASVAYGDVTMAGVGTATSVCGGEVVGFGHPMTFMGDTTMTLHPADALYIQPESLGAPFKVANLGDPAGAITQDRLAGIAGTFGEAPDAADISTTVTYHDDARSGTTHVTVSDWMASALFSHYIANHDRVLEGIVKGSEVQEWTITGTRPTGSAFTLSYADRYTSSYDITWSTVFELADLVWSLSSVPGVTIDSINVDSDVTDEQGTWRLSSVEQRRAGEWHKITRKDPARARAGHTLRVRAVLTGPAGTKTVPVEFKVPRRAKRSETMLSVSGGDSIYNYSWVESVNDAEKMLDSAIRNDQVRIEFGTPDELSWGGCEECEFDFGPRRYSFVKSRLLGPFDKVVEGSKMFRVHVR